MAKALACARELYSEIGEICYRAGLRDGNWELSRKVEREVRNALETRADDTLATIVRYAQRDYDGHSPEKIRAYLMMVANGSIGSN